MTSFRLVLSESSLSLETENSSLRLVLGETEEEEMDESFRLALSKSSESLSLPLLPPPPPSSGSADELRIFDPISMELNIGEMEDVKIEADVDSILIATLEPVRMSIQVYSSERSRS